MTQWNKYLGKRLLVTEAYRSILIEVTILDVSPENKVKLRYENGYTAWEYPETYRLIEVLENEL